MLASVPSLNAVASARGAGARGRVGCWAQQQHRPVRRIPRTTLDQRDLPAAVLIRVSPPDALTRAQRCAGHGTHRPAMRAFDPNGFETTGH